MKKTTFFKILLSIVFCFLYALFMDNYAVKAISYKYEGGLVEVKSTNDFVVNSFSYDYLTIFGEEIKDGSVDLSEYKFYSSSKITVEINNYEHWFHIKDDDCTTIYKYNVNNGTFDMKIGTYETHTLTLDKEGIYKIKYELEGVAQVNYIFITNEIHKFNIDIEHENALIPVLKNFKFNIQMEDGMNLSLNKYSYYFGETPGTSSEYVDIPYNVFTKQFIHEVNNSVSLTFDEKFVSVDGNDSKYFFFKVVDPNGKVKVEYKSEDKYLLSNKIQAVVNIVNDNEEVIDTTEENAYYVAGDIIKFKITFNAPVKYQNLLFSVGDGVNYEIVDSLDEEKNSFIISYIVQEEKDFVGEFNLITKNNLLAIVKYENENTEVVLNDLNANFVVDGTKPELTIVTEGIDSGKSYYDVEINVRDKSLDKIYFYVSKCNVIQGGVCLDEYTENSQYMNVAEFVDNGEDLYSAIIRIGENLGKYDNAHLVLFLKVVDKAGNVTTMVKDGYVLDNVIIPEDKQDNIFVYEDVLDDDTVVGKKISVVVLEQYNVTSIKYYLNEEHECSVLEDVEPGKIKYECFSANYDFAYDIPFEIVDSYGNIEIYKSNFKYSTITNNSTINIPFKDFVGSVTLYNDKEYEVEYVENNLMRTDVSVATFDASTFAKLNQILNINNIPLLTDLNIKLIYIDADDEKIELANNIEANYTLPDLETILQLLEGKFDFKTCTTSKCDLSLYLKYEYKTNGVIQDRFIKIKYNDNSHKFILQEFDYTKDIEVGSSYEFPNYKLITNLNVNIDLNSATMTRNIIYVDKDGNSKVVDKIDVNVLGTYKIKDSFTYNSIASFPLEYQISVVDTQAPVVGLNGDETITIKVGEKFEDPSIIVNDNYDKKFEVLTKWDPKLNESKAGTYKISYWVVDSSGNVSEIITRTVIVEKENNALVYLIIAGIVAFVALVGIVGYFKEFKRKKNG